jgi:fructosamine-3-kinase
MMTHDQIKFLSDRLSSEKGESIPIYNTSYVGGGSINKAARLESDSGKYFVKWNDSNKYPGMFEAEIRGLELMRSTNSVRLPKVELTCSDGDFDYLILEWISAGARKVSFWEDLGRQLSEMHRTTSDQFGLDHDNYIGSLDQSNEPKSTWNEFFFTNRVDPLVEKAGDLLTKEDRRSLEQLKAFVEGWFPNEPPALIHGDLWNGNYMVGPNGGPVIVDPAVYYGHREVDLAMSKLFGGFEERFYEAYDEHFPMESGWKDRLPLYNVYPLLVHIVLFGSGYLAELRSVLNYYLGR